MHSLCGMELVRFVLPHFLSGCIAGAIAAIGLVATNIGSLRDLIFHVDGGLLGFALLTFGCVATFGSIAVGNAVTSIEHEED